MLLTVVLRGISGFSDTVVLMLFVYTVTLVQCGISRLSGTVVADETESAKKQTESANKSLAMLAGYDDDEDEDDEEEEEEENVRYPSIMSIIK